MSLDAKNKPNYANAIDNTSATLAAASAGALASELNAVTLKTAGVSGSQIKSIIISTDETSNQDYFIFIVSADGMTLMPLGIVNVPLGAGSSTGVQSVDAMAQLVGLSEDNQGKKYIDIKADYVLKASCLSNMTAAKNTYFAVISRDFE